MTKLKSLIVVTLALFALVGCSTQQLRDTFTPAATPPAREVRTVSSATMIPPPPPGAILLTSAPPARMSSTFPVSKTAKAVGTPWKVAHEQGFTGDHKVAGKLLGLSAAQVKKYEEMHSAGQFTMVQVPIGATLDGLTFTRNGKHYPQHAVKVEVQNAKHREAAMYHLDGGVYVLRFTYCNNHARINGNPPAQRVAIAAPVIPVALGVCPEGRTLNLHLWDRSRLPSDLQKKLDDLTAQELARNGSFEGPSVSRGMGGELRARAGKGEFSRSGMPAKIVPTLLDGSGNKVGDLAMSTFNAGTFTWRFTNQEIEGKTVSLIFPDSGMISPPAFESKPREMRIFWSEWELYCTLNGHVARR